MSQLLKIYLQCGRPRFDPWVGKIPWRRGRLPTPVFWPGEFHGLYSPWGSQRVGHDWATFTSLHFQQCKGFSSQFLHILSSPCCLLTFWASLVAQLIKNPPAMQGTWVWSLAWEDPLEKGKATHSSILVWRIPWTLLSMGSQRFGHDWVTELNWGLRRIKWKWKSLSHVWLFATPCSIQSMEFSRPEYWSG